MGKDPWSLTTTRAMNTTRTSTSQKIVNGRKTILSTINWPEKTFAGTEQKEKNFLKPTSSVSP
jgi:hypothetical protein